MKKLFTRQFLLLALGLFIGCLSTQQALAQKAKTFKVFISTTENGKEKTYTKTYNSLEELKADPKLKELNFDIGMLENGVSGAFIKSNTESGNSKSFQVVVGNAEKVSIETDPKVRVWVNSIPMVRSFEEKVENGERKVFHFNFNEEALEEAIEKAEAETEVLEEKIEFILKNQQEVVEGHLAEAEVQVIRVEALEDLQEELLEKIELLRKEGNGNMVVHVKVKKKVVVGELKEDDEKAMRKIIDPAPQLKVNAFKAYPNPSNGQFTLAFQSNATDPVSIKVVSLDGQTVYSANLSNTTGQYEQSIDLRGQAPGMYLLQLRQGSKTLNKKIVLE